VTQYANRKETWWEIDVFPTVWLQDFLIPEDTTVSVVPITTDDSLLHYFLSSDLKIETLFFSSALDVTDEPIRYTDIKPSDIPQGEPYVLKKNIPVVVEWESGTDFIATFQAGNVSIGAETFRDAVQWLVVEILDAFDALTNFQSNLGPDAKRQLDILSDYIAKTDGATR
jgi:hypothetical protein